MFVNIKELSTRKRCGFDFKEWRAEHSPPPFFSIYTFIDTAIVLFYYQHMIDLNFTKATASDLIPIFDVYKAAIAHMNEIGIPQWDELYPTYEDIRGDIYRGEHYIGLSEGNIVCAFTLNRDCDSQYEAADWSVRDRPFIVLHRLCVSPAFQNRGAGRKTMLYIEALAQAEGIASIRLDAFSLNPYALRLYEGLGYRRTGTANFRKGLFYLYEKTL